MTLGGGAAGSTAVGRELIHLHAVSCRDEDLRFHTVSCTSGRPPVRSIVNATRPRSDAIAYRHDRLAAAATAVLAAARVGALLGRRLGLRPPRRRRERQRQRELRDRAEPLGGAERRAAEPRGARARALGRAGALLPPEPDRVARGPVRLGRGLARVEQGRAPPAQRVAVRRVDAQAAVTVEDVKVDLPSSSPPSRSSVAVARAGWGGRRWWSRDAHSL